MTASTAATSCSSTIGKASLRALLASWLGWMFDGYETYALVLVMGAAVHQLLPPEYLPKASVYVGGLLAATMLGWAMGGVGAGILADYFGRRRTLMLSILCYAVFSGLAAISWDYWSLLAFRLLTGLGLGAEWGPGAAIVAEQWPPPSRGRAGGALHAAHGVGFLLVSGIWLVVSPLGGSSWRYMFVIGILPALLLLYVRRWVEEPAVWTAANHERREAEQRVQMGSGSSHDKQLVQFTVSEILSDAELRRRVVVLLLMSVATVVGWWSASTWIPEFAAQTTAHSGSQPGLPSSMIGLMFGLGSVAGFLTLGFFADIFGRKATIWFYYLGALTLSLVYFLLPRRNRKCSRSDIPDLRRWPNRNSVCGAGDEKQATANIGFIKRPLLRV
jgi:MFS family permease